ncbi:TPA: hypothetical protein HA249_07395 [Candidatus Woesearchaeota archaeon]|nr:hypothetical protein [Candidatus Woesearchaeota archaeon]
MAMPFPPQNMQTSPYAPTPIPSSPVPLRPLPSEVRRTAQLRCFFRAVVHVLQRQTKPEPGSALKQLGRDLMHFQKHVVAKKHPRLLRQQLDQIQEKVNDTINKEKYILQIHEQEDHLINSMTSRSPSRASLLRRRKASVDQPEGHSPIEFKGHYGSLLRTLGKEPDQSKQTLSDLEEELAKVKQLYKTCRRSSPKAKSQLKRIQMLIVSLDQKIREKKKKN